MPTDMPSRVAIVTGAARGIGRAIAQRLASDGLRVVLNDQSLDDTADDTIRAISRAGGQAFAVRADISQPEEVDRLVQTAISAYGRLDVLVNNAGINRDGLLMRMSEADWDDVLRVNLKGAFLCSRAVLRTMLRQRWGRIISIGSVVGLVGNAGQTNYAAAKAGLVGFTKALAREVASRNITANVVAPGFIEIGMTRALSESIRAQVLQSIPLGRFGQPEDVAAVVAFLASDEAAYLTGQVITVDGGMVMS